MPVPAVPLVSGSRAGAWSAPLAGPGRRLGGYLIDLLVFTPIALIVIMAGLRDSEFFELASRGEQLTQAQLEAFQRDLYWPIAVLALLYGAYLVLFTHLKGQTLGKMAVGIKVVQIEDEAKPSWGRAVIRWVVPALASFVPTVGSLLWLLIYLWIVWDPSRQGLHDKAARTVVLDVRGTR